MMKGLEKKDQKRVIANNSRFREEIFSKVIRAGKRTYFFDVKITKKEEYYLTITESKKKVNPNGDGNSYEKHKLFLYQEDFDKFADCLEDIILYIRSNEIDKHTEGPKDIKSESVANENILENTLIEEDYQLHHV